MQSHLRAVRAAAVLAAAAAAAAGCSSGGSGTASSSSGAGADPGQELSASVKNAQSINSFTATTSVQSTGMPGAGTAGGGGVSLNGTFSEVRKPAELIKFDIDSIQGGGAQLGRMSMIMTPSAMYMKMPMMSSMMHTNKPWVEIPMSSLKSGGALSSLISQAHSSNPLSAAQLLGGATNTRKVGTSTINGVAVTELEGSEPTSAALAKLPANLRSSFGQQVQKLGISQIKFQGWVDGQHNFRKLIVNEVGKNINETVTFTVTSLNQPVQISPPSSTQTSILPPSALNGGM